MGLPVTTHPPLVTAVAHVPTRPRRVGRPLVVELAGPAGAGKSAVARALVQLDPEIRARPHVSRSAYLAGVPALLPTFVGLHWPFRGVLRKEMKRILRLRALHGLAHGTTDCRTLVFDEGPVYMLARILVYGGQNIETRGFARWWRRAIAEWAATLDVIVWLDAPDDVLAGRIHTRPQRHPVQGTDDHALTAFLASYRAAFARVLAELTAAGGPLLWSFATDRGSADLKAVELLARIRARRAAPVRVPEIAV